MTGVQKIVVRIAKQEWHSDESGLKSPSVLQNILKLKTATATAVPWRVSRRLCQAISQALQRATGALGTAYGVGGVKLWAWCFSVAKGHARE